MPELASPSRCILNFEIKLQERWQICGGECTPRAYWPRGALVACHGVGINGYEVHQKGVFEVLRSCGERRRNRASHRVPKSRTQHIPRMMAYSSPISTYCALNAPLSGKSTLSSSSIATKVPSVSPERLKHAARRMEHTALHWIVERRSFADCTDNNNKAEINAGMVTLRQYCIAASVT